MSQTCNKCNTEKQQPPVPFAAHEAMMNRQDRQIKRLWIALIVAISALFASNVGWLIYESQFETISYEQTGEGINNVNLGEQGDLNNGAESKDTSQEKE